VNMRVCMLTPLAPVAPSLTDEEIVTRVQLGETELYQVLAERHKRLFYKIVRRIVPRPSDIEDVLQQAHLRALQHLGQFEGRSSILTWLTRVMANEAYTYLRRRHDSEPLDWEGERDETRPREFAAPEASPEQKAIQAQMRGKLESSIASLPHPYRAVISLRVIGEMPTADTAAYLGISEQGVKTRLLRAKLLLQRKMRDDLGSSDVDSK
jgi:RNA polymerase sigma-70 factor (ECF subfamily)